jgi:hypothetical protein
MGLLDDAIREHLELKRRRGADSTEVARQEREAFGPPGRGELDMAPAEPAPYREPVAGESATLLHEAPTSLHVVGAEHPVQTEPPRPHGDPADALPAAEPAPDHAAPAERPPVIEEHPVVEHRVDLPPAPVQPTREFDAGEVRDATTPPPRDPAAPSVAPEPEHAPEPAAPRAEEGAEEGDDVLEETPEFLQETPEHDRLWFEQRPPRDFDF